MTSISSTIDDLLYSPLIKMKPGDLVVPIGGGGPRMTVESICEYMVDVIWLDDNDEPQSTTYHIDGLEVI